MTNYTVVPVIIHPLCVTQNFSSNRSHRCIFLFYYIPQKTQKYLTSAEEKNRANKNTKKIVRVMR